MKSIVSKNPIKPKRRDNFLRAKMTGEIKTTLEFENYKLLPFLFGDHDRNIARIEQKLRVSIGCFGDQIELKGSEKGVNQAVAAIEALYKKLDMEGNTECIDFDIVDAAIEWILTSTDERGQPDLAGFDNPNFRLETWKRRIVPRSPNQHTYVKGLLESEVTLSVGPAGTGKTYLAIAVAMALQKSAKLGLAATQWARMRI